MDTFLRRCHHIHHLNIGADGRGLSTGVAHHLFRAACQDRVDSQRGRPLQREGQGTVQG
jgi:hypothetical protein